MADPFELDNDSGRLFAESVRSAMGFPLSC